MFSRCMLPVPRMPQLLTDILPAMEQKGTLSMMESIQKGFDIFLSCLITK